ncbi:MAG: methylenetetrahydrofolate reductase C-terminal domain-containing protein [Firmicutes bacterium]|nr:methylenetetrahydrofolate reductase C-terminal domain-containing protein [Bacillota bacterium]
MPAGQQPNRYAQSLSTPGSFSVTWELVPGRGAREPAQEQALSNALEAARGGRIHALTITDNPSGRPALSPTMLGIEIRALGIEPLVHLTCKDKNRAQLESELYALARAGVRNILALSGDYPVEGHQGRPRPVFDLDSVHLLQLIGSLNNGLPVEGPKGVAPLQPTQFFAGAAVSPFKREEAEVLTQYYKLKKKIEAGARFVVTQVGYDARKFHELLLLVREQGWNVPLIGNVYVLTYPAARLMNANEVPGCVVPDSLLRQVAAERQAPDKGREARLLRAAKMVAILKGMGYDGVHIGGHGLKYNDVEFILAKGEELAANWEALLPEFDHPQPGGFYLYQRDPETGLNLPQRAPLGRPQRAPGSYRVLRFLHRWFFTPKRGFFGVMQATARAVDGSRLEGTFDFLEHLTKSVTNDCQHCGDCALFDVAYLCPMSQCAKSQRNGPCGGSHEGWCEVYPGKRKCVYVRAYERLKAYGEQETLAAYTVPPPDWSLYHTSSWLNYFLGRDHTARRLGIRPPAQPPAPSGEGVRHGVAEPQAGRPQAQS